MADKIPFERKFECRYGEIEQLSPLIRRIVANNPGPYTYKGTGTYIIGHGDVAIIDPGPADAAHIEALLQGLGDERISHILVTHTHQDHSPGAALLGAAVGAPTYAHSPHPVIKSDGPQLDHGGDRDFAPDFLLKDNDIIKGPGWSLQALHMPGHIANHLCFCLSEEKALFTGDHVMGWATSVIAPPEGNMAQYFVSLERLLERDDAIYWPSHGGPVKRPKALTRALIAHRRMRERAIAERLRMGDKKIPAIVARLYAGLDPRLEFAAGLSVLAHLEHLIERGIAGRGGAGHDEFFII